MYGEYFTLKERETFRCPGSSEETDRFLALKECIRIPHAFRQNSSSTTQLCFVNVRGEFIDV